MTKIDLYIIKKFLGTFFFAIILIISIAVVFDFSEKLDDFMAKDAPFKAIIFDYYLNFIPYFANLFSSLFTFIAVIFFTSKMAYDTEIIAILSSGVSFKRIMLPYLVSATIIAVFSYLLVSYIIPPANKVRIEFEEVYIKNKYRNNDKNIHKQLKPDFYIYMNNYQTNRNIGYKFSIEQYKNGKLTDKLFSDYIEWKEDLQKWRIKNYYIRHYTRKGETIESGKIKDTILNMVPKDFGRRLKIVETMNNKELDEFIKEEQMHGVSVDAYLIEKHRRIAFPFSTFILTLIGVSLASRKLKGGIGMHIGVGILLSFTYILFMQISSVFATSGNLHPMIAVWIPNIIFLFIGIYLYKKAPK